MKITALDLGAATGIAYGAAACNPTVETWQLRGGSLGERLLLLHEKLDEHLTEFAPNCLYIERPMGLRTMMKVGANEGVLHSLYGYNGVALMLGAKHRLLTMLIDVQAVRRHFLGYKPKGGEGKRLVIDWCRQLGWEVGDNNQADAAALWDYAQATENAAAHLHDRLRRSVAMS